MTTHDYAMTWPVLDDSLSMAQLQRLAEPEFMRKLSQDVLDLGGIA